jgi:hypothetical protein
MWVWPSTKPGVTFGVERFLGGRGDAADLRDLSILDADVAAIARQSGTIDDHAVLDDEVECHGSPPSVAERYARQADRSTLASA